MRASWLRSGLAGVTVVVCLGAGGGEARADDDDWPGPTGVELGFRTGFGKGFGRDLEGDDDSGTSALKGQIPIWIDLGYRIPRLFVGGFFQYGFVLIGDNPTCDKSNVSCNVYDIRFGIESQFHILPGKIFDPWLGVGFGYEILGQSISSGSQSVSVSLRGLQFVDFQVGGDYRVSDSFAIGPFVDFSVGQFSSASISAPAPIGDTDADIKDQKIHEWLTLGVRGVFDIAVGDEPKYEHKRVPKERESKSNTPDTAEPPAPAPTPATPPDRTGPEQKTPPVEQKGVTAGAAGAWPAGVPIADRGTCSFVCVAKEGANPRESDKAALAKALDKHLGALRACVGGGRSAAGVVVSFDSRGNGIVNYSFGPRATARADCPGSFPPVQNVSGPPSSTWQCTDYCE